MRAITGMNSGFSRPVRPGRHIYVDRMRIADTLRPLQYCKDTSAIRCDSAYDLGIVPRSTALPVLSSSFSSLIFALLPKCPACLVVLLAPLGIKVPDSRWFLAYVCVLAAAIPLVFFLTPACRKCGMRPLALSLTGLAAMTVGHVFIDNLVLVAVGALLMFVSAFWTARANQPSCARA